MVAVFFHFITFRPGKNNLKVDILSRGPDYEMPPTDHNILRLLDPSKIAKINAGSYNTIHRRLGHVGESMLRKTVDASEELVLTSTKPRCLCEPCLLGKTIRARIRDVSTKDLELLEVVQADTQGPFPIRIYDGSLLNKKRILKMETIKNLEASTMLEAFKHVQQ
jgi:hypothetical protein